MKHGAHEYRGYGHDTYWLHCRKCECGWYGEPIFKGEVHNSPTMIDEATLLILMSEERWVDLDPRDSQSFGHFARLARS